MYYFVVISRFVVYCNFCKNDNAAGKEVCDFCGEKLSTSRPHTIFSVRSPTTNQEDKNDSHSSKNEDSNPMLAFDAFNENDSSTSHVKSRKIQENTTNHASYSHNEHTSTQTKYNTPTINESSKIIGAVVIQGPTGVSSFPLYNTLLKIGRDNDVELSIQDSSISGFHGSILLKSTEYRYVDNSRNGSIVDGKSLNGDIATIRNGSEIKIGEHKLILFFGEK